MELPHHFGYFYNDRYLLKIEAEFNDDDTIHQK